MARQVQIACSHAVRGAARLSGAEPASVEDKETSFDELKGRIAKTLAFLKSVDAKKMDGMEDRERRHPLGAVADVGYIHLRAASELLWCLGGGVWSRCCRH